VTTDGLPASDGKADDATNVDTRVVPDPPPLPGADAGAFEALGDAPTAPGDATVGPGDDQLCRELCALAASTGCQPTVSWSCHAGCLRLVATCGDSGRAFNACSARQPPAMWTCDPRAGIPTVRLEACPAEEAAVKTCLCGLPDPPPGC
jgi:hypothetical protein